MWVFLFFCGSFSSEVSSVLVLLNLILELAGHRKKRLRKKFVYTKERKQVIKAIVASLVHSADGLIPVAVRVSHLHLPQRIALDLTTIRKK